MGSTERTLKKKYDVLIVGGGLVGASLAAMLANLALDILVVEKFALAKSNDPQSENNSTQNFDARSTALSYGSKQIYQKLGLWKTLEPFVCSIKTVHASQKGAWGSTSLSAEQQQLPALGYVIENQSLGRTLWQHVQTLENVDWFAPARVERINMQAHGAQVEIAELDSDKKTHEENEPLQSISCELLVLADGAQSPCSKMVGIDHHITDYKQTALIANIVCEQPHQGQAFERFTAKGPMALLPLNDFNDQKNRAQHRMALVWVLDHEQAAHWKNASAEACLARLETLFAQRLGRLSAIGERVSFPLSLSCAKEQLRSSVVVMGNAAHSLHPVAGQGFNLALRDCVNLSEHLAQAIEDKKSLGDLEVLQQYLDAQKFDQQRTIFFSDSIPKIFSSQNSLIKAGRGAGMLGLSLLPALRSKFVSISAGLNESREQSKERVGEE